MTDVSKEIKSLRKRLGISAVKFAKLIGSNMSSVYNWEHGYTSPANEKLWKRIYKLVELFERIENNPDVLLK
jgi:DNA-binding transcriptional regulator YiaG